MKIYKRYYIKYMVKSPILFYTFLLLFIGIFVFTGLSVKLNVFQSYQARLEDGIITVASDSKIMLHDDQIYYYTDRNDRVYKAQILGITFERNMIYLTLDGNGNQLEGEMTVEFVVGRQSLLKRIFLKGGKG